MLVQTADEKGKTYFVLKQYLPDLIKQRRIAKFRRSGEWVDIDSDQRKEITAPHDGIEKRMGGIVDLTLFTRTIEEQLSKGQSLETILGYGQRAREIASSVKNASKTNLSVLLQGKTGTGKGVAALIIHSFSKRRDKPFVRVDCGAIPPTLIESELFGFEKGSFTGAYRSKPGRFEIANGGTVFLDEIGNLGMDMQTRLLGFLEERVVHSIGRVSPVKLDVRIISASNADLLSRVRSCQFREDLFYRLKEFEIHMPSLTERSDDRFYFATKFLTAANAELEKNVFGFSEGAVDFLSGCECSGNIRELKNLIKRAALLAGDMIEDSHLQSQSFEGGTTVSLDSCLENALVKGYKLNEINEMLRKMAERRIIERAYEQSYRNKRKTCQTLRIDYSTLFRKMREYNIK